MSVIVGLLFVTVRVMTMGMPENWAQTHEASTTVVKTEALPLATNDTVTKTP